MRKNRGKSTGGNWYRKRTKEDLKNQKSKNYYTGDSYLPSKPPAFRPKEGKNRIRILPPSPIWIDELGGDRHYGHPIWVHYGVGADKSTYACLRKMKDEACPVCEERERAVKERESKQYIDDLQPKLRMLYLIVDRKDEESDVKIWSATVKAIDEAITNLSEDEDTGEVLFIDSPEDGHDVRFMYTPPKGTVPGKYDNLGVIQKSSAVGNDEALDFVRDNALPNLVVYHDYERIKKVLEGGVGFSSNDEEEDDDDDEHEEKKTRRSSKPKRARKEEPEDVDDDDEEEETSDNESEDLTWEEVQEMNEDSLMDALADNGFDKEEIGDMEDEEEMRKELCDELGLEPPAKPKKEKEAEKKARKLRRNKK
jgi:hypothetical protein